MVARSFLRKLSVSRIEIDNRIQNSNNKRVPSHYSLAYNQVSIPSQCFPKEKKSDKWKRTAITLSR